MELLHIIVLALIQGITEFLPISSSGHLLLPKELLGWPEQGLAFDVAVHVGTLLAVVGFFYKDIISIVKAWFASVTGGGVTVESRLAWYIVAGTVPAGLVGLILGDFIEANLRTTFVIAATTIVFGLLLAFADRKASQCTKELANITLMAAVIIGCFQAIALIPGTSRSGITITAALLLGFSRNASAKFSFLLSIPVIVLSGGLKTIELMALPAVNWGDLFLGIVLSAISAVLCIHYFLKFINQIGMMPFVYYRLVLGGILLLFGFGILGS